VENQVVVTRHPALLEYLREQGLCDSAAVVIEHATPDDICGRHVVGVLPLHLAAEAASVTEIKLDLPADARGRELSLEEVRQYAGEPSTYVVFKAARANDGDAIADIYHGDHASMPQRPPRKLGPEQDAVARQMLREFHAAQRSHEYE